MKIKFNVKRVIKIIALALAGVAALTGVGFGVKAIVDYTKNDLKTISPSFEVGNLGSDGKFVNDESTLYTKDSFACNGLNVKLVFDNEINYQIYYYDDLDNYISSTAILSDSFDKQTEASHARIVIKPKDDDDDKISFTERYKYSGQMTIKVSKNQELRFAHFDGAYLKVVDNIVQMHYTKGLGLEYSDGEFSWLNEKYYACTSTTVLKVGGGEKISYDFKSESATEAFVFEFSDLPSNNTYISRSTAIKSEPSFNTINLKKNTRYILISVLMSNRVEISDSEVDLLPLSFTCEKVK